MSRHRTWIPLALLTLVALAASIALAQRPLIAPTYYLVTAPELAPGVPVEGALTREDGQNFVDGRRVDVLVLRPTPGDMLTLEVVSEEFDPYLSVFDPDGEVVLSVDDGPEGVNPRGTVAFDRPGAHLVVVSGYGPEDLGRYRATARVARASPTESLPLPGRVSSELALSDAPNEMASPGPARTFDLEVDEGRLVRLRARSTAFDTILTVADEDGFVAENDDAGDTTDSELYLQLAPGRYEVIVTSWSETGSGAFEVVAEAYIPVE